MNPKKIYVAKYIFDNYTIKPLLKADCSTDQERQTWENISSFINEAVELNKSETSDDFLFEEHPGVKEGEDNIILLLLKSKSLANSSFNIFNALLETKDLRPHVPPKERKKPRDINYYPIITLCYTDIASLHAEEKEDRGGEQESKWNELTYNIFDFDSRVKFLDSSVWHRFVPFINPYDGDKFSARFKNVIEEIKGYYEKGLYYSIAANVTLEFHMRMLHNSYIARIGNRGHSESVTPFKFHSETQMQRKVDTEKKFLNKIWPGNLKLAEEIKWRILVVDDQADSEISSLSEDKKCRVTKRTLLERPFSELYEAEDNFDSHPGKNENIEIYAPEADIGIINWAIDRMKNHTFDIIFLDYLLGYEKEDSLEREYGFEFLMKLLQDNNRNIPELRRDFLGKYWIFPISAFPHALPDKLSQLGVGHLHEIWHLSQGGDPISTPHLYAYNLHRFMKQRIREFFLYPKALKSFFHRIIVGGENGRIRDEVKNLVWSNFLIQAIGDVQKRFMLLKEFSNETYGKNSSRFVYSIIQFLKIQHKEYFEKLFSLVMEISARVNNIASKSDYEEVKKLLEDLNILTNNIKSEWKDADFVSSLELYEVKVKQAINEPTRKAIDRINAAAENEQTKLDLSSLGMIDLPLEIRKVRKLHVLDLSHNKLSDLPITLETLNELEKIDLKHNAFKTFPDILLKINTLEKIILSDNEIFELPAQEIRKLKRLDTLNIQNNPIDVEPAFAESKQAVSEMLNRVEQYLENRQKVDYNRLIITGKFNSIFEKVRNIELDNYDRDKITLLEGEYRQLVANNGQLSNEQYTLQLNRIRKALLLFVKRISK